MPSPAGPACSDRSITSAASCSPNGGSAPKATSSLRWSPARRAGGGRAPTPRNTQRDTARLLVQQHRAHYLLIVKVNQPTLHAAVIARPTGPDTDFPTHRTHDRGHGPTEERITRIAAATGIDLPYAAQVVRVVRHRGDLTDTRRSKHVVYGIIDLPCTLAGPQHIATYARCHWEIENDTHHIRDLTSGEDGHQARTGTQSRAMAIFRNLAIGAPRHAGHANIAHARREYVYDHRSPLTLLAIAPTGSP